MVHFASGVISWQKILSKKQNSTEVQGQESQGLQELGRNGAVVLLIALFLITTLPFVSRSPFNWDAAQFVLGVHYFAMPMHQPHPPGYPLFIGLGKVLALIVDAHTALLIIS